MNKAEAIERAIQILEKLPRDVRLHQLDEAFFRSNLPCTVSYGASRYAIVFKKHGFVLKFPRYSNTHLNYCKKEIERYLSAQNLGIEKILLPIESLQTLQNGLPIYIQPTYFSSAYDLDKREAMRLEEKIHRTVNAENYRKVKNGMFNSPDKLWLHRAIQLYGKQFMKKVELWTMEWRVDDLHSGNVAYLPGLKPVLSDYAGYEG